MSFKQIAARVVAGGCLFVGSAMVVNGCSNGGMPTASVTGTVTLDGVPVEGATVNFQPIAKPDQMESGKMALGTTDANGKFSLHTYGSNDGAVIGKHRVGVVPKEGVPKMGPRNSDQKPSVPDKYWGARNSGIEVEVKAGGVDVPLKLESGK